MDKLKMQITVKPLRVLGFDQFQATVKLETGTTVYETARWSEAGAFTAAVNWIHKNGGAV